MVWMQTTNVPAHGSYRRARAALTLALLGAWAAPLRAQEPEAVPPPRDVTEETRRDPRALERLQTPGRIVFEESFEAPDALAAWYDLLGAAEGRTVIVRDAKHAHTGEAALQLTTVDRDGKSCGAGATRWIAAGHDVLHLRRYVRFAADYDQGDLHHVGGSLYAVAGEDRWAEMGKAGIRPRGDDRFGASFEPWRAWGRHAPPGAMMLYTYWMDMRRDRDGNFWGNLLAPVEAQQKTLERDRWTCLEHAIRVNTPGEADGEMAAWIDGVLYVHLVGLRWRTSADVRLKRVHLGLYVHRSRRTNRVWYDDVVVSTGWVGPRREDAPAKRR